PRQRGTQTHVGERQRIAVACTALQTRTQALEIVDDSRHRQLRRGATRHEIGNTHDATLSNQSRQHLSASGFLEQSKSHDSLLYTILSYLGRSREVQLGRVRHTGRA